MDLGQPPAVLIDVDRGKGRQQPFVVLLQAALTRRFVAYFYSAAWIVTDFHHGRRPDAVTPYRTFSGDFR